MSVCVPIPGLRTVCELNAHEHWRVRSKRAKTQRELVTLVLRRTVAPMMLVGAPLVVTLTRVAPSQGLDDGDNLPSAHKHVRDAVAALLGIDDRDPRVSWRYAQRRGPWGIEIAIEPASDRTRETISSLHGGAVKPHPKAEPSRGVRSCVR